MERPSDDLVETFLVTERDYTWVVFKKRLYEISGVYALFEYACFANYDKR